MGGGFPCCGTFEVLMSDRNRVILVYAARHGSTVLNGGVGGRDCFRGKVDVPLDKAGFRDANALAVSTKGRLVAMADVRLALARRRGRRLA